MKWLKDLFIKKEAHYIFFDGKNIDEVCDFVKKNYSNDVVVIYNYPSCSISFGHNIIYARKYIYISKKGWLSIVNEEDIHMFKGVKK